jgi:hypothetical protein
MLTLRNFQTSAVTELLEKNIPAPSLGDDVKYLFFDSLLDRERPLLLLSGLSSLWNNCRIRIFRASDNAFLWIAPQQLHIQSRLKLKSFLRSTGQSDVSISPTLPIRLLRKETCCSQLGLNKQGK